MLHEGELARMLFLFVCLCLCASKNADISKMYLKMLSLSGDRAGIAVEIMVLNKNEQLQRDLDYLG